MPKKPTIGQWIVFGGGLLVFIALFIPWFTLKGSVMGVSVAIPGFSSSNAFGSPLGWLGGLLVLAAAILIALKLFLNLNFNAGPLKVEHFALMAAGLGTLFIIVQVAIGKSVGSALWADLMYGAPEGVGLGYSRGAGAFIALIAGLAVVGGTFMCMKEAGLGFGAFKSMGGAGAPPPPPPPPPPEA